MDGLVVHQIGLGLKGAASTISRGGTPAHDATMTMSLFFCCVFLFCVNYGVYVGGGGAPSGLWVHWINVGSPPHTLVRGGGGLAQGLGI